MTDDNPLADEWSTCAAFAAELLGQREERVPARLAAGAIDAAEAARQLRVTRAIAEQWRAVAALEPLALDADGLVAAAALAELERELVAIEARAAAIAAAAPADEEKARRLRLTRALLFYQRPHGRCPDPRHPLIWILHAREGRRRAWFAAQLEPRRRAA